MWARDPWSAQDMSTSNNLCSPGDGYGDDHDEEKEGHNNDDQHTHLLDVVILHGLFHPAE